MNKPFLRSATRHPLSALVLLVGLAGVGCGDDSPSDGGSGGNGGNGGNGGEGGEMVTVNNMPTTGTNMPQSVVGQPCESDSECDGGFCLTEEFNGFPLGYCSAECQDDLDCGGETCLIDQSTPVCVKGCRTTGDCRDAYECIDLGGNRSTDVCFPACTTNSQCTAPQECITEAEDPNLGFCIEPEKCADLEDNDHDDFPDCADDDCSEDAGCIAAIGEACTGAGEITSPEEGTTADGEALFVSVCGPFITGAGREVLFQYTATLTGELHLEVAPSGDADLALYVRGDCDDAGTVLACTDDPQDPSATEIVDIGVTSGTTYTVFVDSYALGTEGNYSLTSSFVEAVCGDGTTTLPEQCDDSNVTPGDGCSDTCNIELDFYCGAATPISLGTTQGNTNTGTSFFEAPVDDEDCLFGAGGGGREKLYVYTPAASGTLTIELDPDADMGLYARTDCVDGASQLGCADVNFMAGMQEETLVIPVTADVPVTIFVDAYQSDGGPFSITLSQ